MGWVYESSYFRYTTLTGRLILADDLNADMLITIDSTTYLLTRFHVLLFKLNEN